MFTASRLSRRAVIRGTGKNCMEACGAAKMTVVTNFRRSWKANLGDIGPNVKINSQICLSPSFLGCRFDQMAGRVFGAAANPSGMPCATYNSSLFKHCFAVINRSLSWIKRNLFARTTAMFSQIATRSSLLAAVDLTHHHRQPENNGHPRRCVDFDDNALQYTAELASNQERFRIFQSKLRTNGTTTNFAVRETLRGDAATMAKCHAANAKSA